MKTDIPLGKLDNFTFKIKIKAIVHITGMNLEKNMKLSGCITMKL